MSFLCVPFSITWVVIECRPPLFCWWRTTAADATTTTATTVAVAPAAEKGATG